MEIYMGLKEKLLGLFALVEFENFYFTLDFESKQVF